MPQYPVTRAAAFGGVCAYLGQYPRKLNQSVPRRCDDRSARVEGMKTTLPSIEPSEGEIQHAAYTLWEAAGRPSGRDLEFWLTARERLRHTLHVARTRRLLAKPAAIAARNAQPPGRKKP